MTTPVECPHCHQLNTPPPSTIGRYVTCSACGTRFYVYVPPPEMPATSGLIETPAAAADRHSHSEGRVLMRQESLLATIHDDLVDLRRQVVIASLVFVAGCSAVVATLLLR